MKILDQITDVVFLLSRPIPNIRLTFSEKFALSMFVLAFLTICIMTPLIAKAIRRD